MSLKQPSVFGTYPWARGTTSSPVLYGTGYIPETLAVVLADAVTPVEAPAVNATKAVADFLLLKEWLAINLIKEVVWINPSQNANIFDTLWGTYRFGTSLFGGLKPLATWTSASRGRITWTNANGFKYNS